ncbi:VTT domain-containing protein [Motilimonas cestriensis]|uniref:TVP38/TMEM64 family membrane protein n=1 Tax=Motilimonas cestriensis TaxID=2742685 RepID=A0ABS8W418_9GAMM|nr:VTT domain-containing protein [Motilimonas cestriensis]MCE2593699.1 VTT domain-containing protein [Motilimonas cestriensis]
MKWVKITLFVTLLSVLAISIDSPIWLHLADSLWLEDYITQHGNSAHFTIFITSILFLFIGGPRQVVAFLFAYLYGVMIGVSLALFTCLVAAAANYFIANLYLKNTLHKKLPLRMEKFSRFAKHKPFLKILTLRLFPFGSNLLTNTLSGGGSVPFFPFITASLVGYLPQTIIFSLVGDGMNDANSTMLYISIIMALISFILSTLLYRDHIKQRLENLKMEVSN